MAKANPFRFSTKYQDDETDLLYYGYRYYNAGTGRWLSRDPEFDWTGNLYSFLENSPLTAIDPYGLATLSVGIVALYGLPSPLDPDVPDAEAVTRAFWSPDTKPPRPPMGWPRECAAGRYTIDQHDWAVLIVQKFAVDYAAAQSRPAALTITLQQHEDMHAYYALAFTTFAWNSVALMDQKCPCRDCFDAWADWQIPAVTLAYDLYRWYTIQLDIASYPIHPFTKKLRQEAEQLKPEIALLRPIVQQKLETMVATCKNQLNPTATAQVSPPTIPPILPRP